MPVIFRQIQLNYYPAKDFILLSPDTLTRACFPPAFAGIYRLYTGLFPQCLTFALRIFAVRYHVLFAIEQFANVQPCTTTLSITELREQQLNTSATTNTIRRRCGVSLLLLNEND